MDILYLTQVCDDWNQYTIAALLHGFYDFAQRLWGEEGGASGIAEIERVALQKPKTQK
jgi:hypothetical protein